MLCFATPISIYIFYLVDHVAPRTQPHKMCSRSQNNSRRANTHMTLGSRQCEFSSHTLHTLHPGKCLFGWGVCKILCARGCCLTRVRFEYVIICLMRTTCVKYKSESVREPECQTHTQVRRTRPE